MGLDAPPQGENTGDGNFDSIETDDATFNDSVTTPDGTKYTGAIGGLVPLNRKTASSQGQLDFNSNLTGYDTYVVKIEHFIPASDGDNLEVLVSTDNGSTYETGSSAYGWRYDWYDAGANGGNNQANGQDRTRMGRQTGNASGEYLQGTLVFSNLPDSGRFSVWEAYLTEFETSGTLVRVESHAWRKNTETNDAIRLQYGGGDISEGEASLYGVVEP